MTRQVQAVCALSLVTFMTTGCNTLSCGPGTERVQGAGGELQCLPVDVPSQLIPCDVDGGSVDIVAGNCVSHIKCDPATTMYDPTTGVCVGTGAGVSCDQACPSPIPADSVCVTGGVVDFQSNMHVTGGASSRPLRIGAYEPLAFLANPTSTPPLAEDPSTTNGCFTFLVKTPASNLVALAVQDPVGSTPAMPLAVGGSGATVVSGHKYQVDAYLVLQATLDAYAAVTPSFKTSGTYVACYYDQPPPAPTNFLFTETMPASGVQLLENGVTPAAAHYLAASGAIDGSLTGTSAARGCGITVGTGGINQYTGSGGGVTKWETEPGGTAPNTVFVARFHSCDNAAPGTPTCQ
jgi:hypothetical protein